MTISISLPVLLVIFVSVVTIYSCFKGLAGGSDAYGIGAMFAFFISAFLTCFYVAVLFAGSYFKWWML